MAKKDESNPGIQGFLQIMKTIAGRLKELVGYEPVPEKPAKASAVIKQEQVPEKQTKTTVRAKQEPVPEKPAKASTVTKQEPEMSAKTSAGITKEYLEGGRVCRVTFTLPEAAAPDAESVYVVGDFNKWNNTSNPMKRLENGDFMTMLDLDTGNEYQFLYLVDESKWENDWNADKYVKSPYGENENSVVIA